MLKGKISIALLALVILTTAIWADELAVQNEEIPSAIVNFIDGLNKHSYITAKPYISKDFEIEGVPEEYMSQALTQVFSSFPMKIDSYLYKSHNKSNLGSVYTISFMFNNHVRDVDFGLDKENKVLSCSMFRAQQSENMASNDYRKLVPYAEADFELINGIIILQGELNGEKAKFVLDSGAPMLVINSSADSTQGNAVIAGAQGIGGSIQNMGFAHVSYFNWAGGGNESFDTVSMDLSHLEAELGIKFQGLISKAELEPYETYIDYSTHKIRFYQLKDNGDLLEPEKLKAAKSQIKFNLSAHIACLKATVGKKKVTLGLDTGAQTNLLDDDYYNEFKKIMTSVQTDTLSGADTNTAVISTGIISETKLGKAAFPDMRYAFSDISVMNNAYHLNIDGLLGYPFLSQHPFSINYRKKVIRFY